VKRFAERVAPVAQTTHPTQAGLARVLNSLVVPPFLRRGILVCLRGSSNAPIAAETPLEPLERNMWLSRGHIWSRARADIKLLMLLLITYLTCIDGFTS